MVRDEEISEDDRTTALGTVRFALEYFAAAIAAHERLEKSAPAGLTAMPVYSLAGQSVELSLKAFLRQQGESLSALRAIRHDLVKALERAEAVGLIHRADRGQVERLNQEYSSHRFRYIRTGYVQLLEVQHLFPLVANLLYSSMIGIPGAWRFMWHTPGKIVADAGWMSPIEIKRASAPPHD